MCSIKPFVSCRTRCGIQLSLPSAIVSSRRLWLRISQLSIRLDTENQNHGDNMVQTFNMIPRHWGVNKTLRPRNNSTMPVSMCPSMRQAVGTSLFTRIGASRTTIPGTTSCSPDKPWRWCSHFSEAAATVQQGGGDLLGSLLGGGQPQSNARMPGIYWAHCLVEGNCTAKRQSGWARSWRCVECGHGFMNAKQQGQNLCRQDCRADGSRTIGAKPHRQQSDKWWRMHFYKRFPACLKSDRE